MCRKRYAADIPFLLPNTQLPPTRSDFSKQSNAIPRWCNAFAAAMPDDPAPMTAAFGKVAMNPFSPSRYEVDARVILAAAALVLLALAPPAAAQRAVTACAPFSSDCAMPFPNDLRLLRDGKVRLPQRGLPANKDGRRVSPAPYARSDGFSPGQQIIVRAPGFQTPGALVRAKVPPLHRISQYR